ncbi:MAG: PepSY domain-containing protein [Methanoregula sp.]|uniref:PepSY domain-containing protein n=1 Tax=Methanoregula sp. TaxID=2052170 RepID=UPI003C749D69
MKRTRIVCIVLAAICLLACLQGVGAMSIRLDPPATSQGIMTASAASAYTASASANDNYPISMDQAKNNIRVFMGDLSLDPVLSTTGSLPIGNYYYFTAGNSTFLVNENSGAVEFVHFGDNARDSSSNVLTRDQAYANATAYASGKFTDFSSKNWKLVFDQVDTNYEWYYNPDIDSWNYVTVNAYDFVFREEKDNVLLPTLVHVSVNTKTGSIIDYWGVDRLLTLSNLENTVSLSKAVATAEDYVGTSGVESTEGHREVITQYQNLERLAWVITLTENGGYSYTVVVDATDGSFIGSQYDDSIWPEAWLLYNL